MRYDAARDTFVNCSLPGVSGSLSDFCVDAANRLWIRSEDGEIAAYLPTPRGFRLARRLETAEISVSGLHTANGFLFLSSSEGSLFRINPRTLDLEQIADLGSAMSAITWYGGRYYIALVAQGLRTFDASFASQPLAMGLQPLEGMKIRG